MWNGRKWIGLKWHDIDGEEYDCAMYVRANACKTDGDLWAWGGLTANLACCGCGGGAVSTVSIRSTSTIFQTSLEISSQSSDMTTTSANVASSSTVETKESSNSVEPDLSPTFTTPRTLCRDSSSTCASWSMLGYCEPQSEYNSWMRNNCQLSCGICTENPCTPGAKSAVGMCVKCTSDFARCLECGESQYLHDGMCVVECPVDTNPVGLGEFSRVCVKELEVTDPECGGPSCQACSRDSICIRCKHGKFLHRGECLTECPILPPARHEVNEIVGFHPYIGVGNGSFGRECVTANSACGIAGCFTCALPGDAGYTVATAGLWSRESFAPVCTLCSVGWLFLNGRCVKRCPPAPNGVNYVVVEGSAGGSWCRSPCAASVPDGDKPCECSAVKAFMNATSAKSLVGEALPFELEYCTK